MSKPASHTWDREENREHVSREPKRLINYPTVEAHVRVDFTLDEVFVGKCDALELHCDLNERLLAQDLEHFICYLLDYFSARVVILIHTVAEAHQLTLFVLDSFDEGGDVLLRPNVF